MGVGAALADLGAALGLTATLQKVGEPSVHERCRALLGRMVATLHADKWWIISPNVNKGGSGGGYGSSVVPVEPMPGFIALWQKIALTVDPVRWASLAPPYERMLKLALAADFTPRSAAKYDPSYFGANLCIINIAALALLQDESDGESREQVWSALRHIAMVGYDHLSASFPSHFLSGTGENGTDAARHAAAAMLQATMLDLAGAGAAVKWDAFVDLRNDTSLGPHYSSAPCTAKSCMAEYAYPASLRPRNDYLWQRSPVSLIGGNAATAHEYAAIDVMLPYWMGRATGAIPGPSPSETAASDYDGTAAVAPETCGPPPPQFTKIAHSCMGDPSTCKGETCDCAANVQLSAGSCKGAECFETAAKACAANKRCRSFAVLGKPCDGFSNYSGTGWQIYSVGSGNAVRNIYWTAFATHSSAPVEPPPPPPPPLPSPPWAPRSPCVDDTDCALLGKCAGGKCACSSGWKGPACQTLDLLPAAATGAYGWAPNVSAWGAHVIEKAGTYHMYAAELWNDCGIDSWGKNCHIVHATSSTAAGPFTYRDTPLGPFSCNPHAIDVGSGELALFHIGTGIGSASIECQNKTGHGDAPLPHEVWPKQTVGASVHTSHGTDGPWTAAQDGIHGCNNPAPARHPNGSIFVVCHNSPEL